MYLSKISVVIADMIVRDFITIEEIMEKVNVQWRGCCNSFEVTSSREMSQKDKEYMLPEDVEFISTLIIMLFRYLHNALT